MKFAILCSAGGSAFFAAYDILLKARVFSKDNFVIITDRPCAAEVSASDRGLDCYRVNYESKKSFSENVATILVKKNVSVLFMLYSRLISEELFSTIPTLNIHPALLPAFKGINAIGQAIDYGVKFIGSTLHITTEKMDEGMIVGQVISPVSTTSSKEEFDRLSHIQKTYLILMILDCFKQGYIELSSNVMVLNWLMNTKFNHSANPSIQSEEINCLFNEYQDSLGMPNQIL